MLVRLTGVLRFEPQKRIVWMLTEGLRRLNFSRKWLLNLAGTVALAALPVFGLLSASQGSAQAAAENQAQGIVGTWQGTLHAGRDLRLVMKISNGDGGGYKAVSYSIDQGGDPIPVAKITLEGTAVSMSVTAIGGTYEGKLGADGKTITGTWTQGPNPLALNLERATPATEWTIPPPTPRLPPMAANADPTFEVATIKPSKPDTPGKMFRVQGRRFKTVNTTLNDLISFAYGVHSKQVIGAPAWADTDKFDIDAEPDGEGAPNDKQWKSMMKKLIVERFKLKSHQDKRELSVYVLSVSKAGQKMTKSEGDPNGLPGLWFQQLGNLNVRNANMADFAGLMQSAVLDRPVLDQTGIVGRWDFTLKWTPDDSQFSGFGARIPPPADGATAPPNLYTAIQEQVGLKLEATKAQADVMVIDQIEKPSDN